MIPQERQTEKGHTKTFAVDHSADVQEATQSLTRAIGALALGGPQDERAVLLTQTITMVAHSQRHPPQVVNLGDVMRTTNHVSDRRCQPLA